MAALAEVQRDEWITALHGPPAVREPALAELHALLLRAARFELGRRRSMLSDVPPAEIDDMADQAADDAMVALLAKLDSFRGASRFTTWAYKFALLEAAVKVRKRAWQGRELPVEPEAWSRLGDDGASPSSGTEQRELLDELQKRIKSDLSAHQREVLVAVAVNGVPIDVIAERLNTTRGALYKTIHDARKKLRAGLKEAGLDLPGTTGVEER